MGQRGDLKESQRWIEGYEPAGGDAASAERTIGQRYWSLQIADQERCWHTGGMPIASADLPDDIDALKALVRATVDAYQEQAKSYEVQVQALRQ